MAGTKKQTKKRNLKRGAKLASVKPLDSLGHGAHYKQGTMTSMKSGETKLLYGR